MQTKSPTALDPHSYSRPAAVGVTHIALDWTVDFEARALRGTATLSLAREEDEAELVLDGRELLIERIDSDDGQPLAFEVDRPEPLLGDRVRVQLRLPRMTFLVFYSKVI